MFLAAGYLIEQLTAKRWEDAVRERILEPLTMNRSNFANADSQKDPDHSKPYRRDADTEKVIEIPYRELGNMGPAGSVPTVSRELVAFGYAGDLWVASRSGGQARRVTATPGGRDRSLLLS